MRCRLGFARTFEGKLLVLTDVRSFTTVHGGMFATQFDDEDAFFGEVLRSNFKDEVIAAIVGNGLLAVSKLSLDANWVPVVCSLIQLRQLGLNVSLSSAGQETTSGATPNNDDLALALTASPSPIVVLNGPQHVFTFINPAYVRLLGRRSADSFLGKPVREALPELPGQPFLPLLDTVYRTGEPFIGREIQGKFLNEETGEMDEIIFDFVYHPVRDAAGEVCGILCQANNVSERVLARHVSEARETKLYEQWAELEAIYKSSPFAMALIEVREFRIARINDVNAALLGKTPQELLGKRVFELFPELHPLKVIYQRVAAGEEIRNVRFEIIPATTGQPPRVLLSNFSPVLNVRGEIVAIASIALDLSEPMTPLERVVIDLSTTSAASKQASTAPLT